jgi:hypothetical protein
MLSRSAEDLVNCRGWHGMQGVRGLNPLSSTRHNARIPLQVVAKVSLTVFPEHSKCLTSSAIGAHVVERCFNRLKQVRGGRDLLPEAGDGGDRLAPDLPERMIRAIHASPVTVGWATRIVGRRHWVRVTAGP